MWKFEEQFRKAYPETIGETDKHFDLDNYKDWLEQQLLNKSDAIINECVICGHDGRMEFHCPKCGNNFSN